MTDPMKLEVGSDRGQGRVIVKIGAVYTTLDPPTARATAIALIHAAEVAGLPPPAPQKPIKTGLKLVS